MSVERKLVLGWRPCRPVLSVFLFLVASASAETRYVSSEGSAESPFTSWETAAHDIASALDVAGDGDQIVVAPGTYSIDRTIVVNRVVTLRSAAGARETVLDGNGSPRNGWCFDVQSKRAIVDGFTITRFGGGVLFSHREGTDAVVRNCVIVRNSGRGIFFKTSGCAKNCTVAYNGGPGLYAYQMGGGGDPPANLILFGNEQAFVRQSANISLVNSYTDDPHFVSEKDFRLRPDSPCIDAGRNEDWMSEVVDAAGRPRIQNKVVDIGAYEFEPAKIDEKPSVSSDRLLLRSDGKPSDGSDRSFQIPRDVKRVLIEVELDDREGKREVIVRGGRITRVEFDLRPQATTDARAADEPPAPDASRLIGRTTVRGDDVGVVFHYELGKPLTHETIQQHVPVEDIPRTRGVQITLAGSLQVPEKTTVLAWHAGGSPTGGVHRLYVDGKEVGSIGDDRIKNTVYRLELNAGAHPVKWILTGGDFGPCVLQFVDLRTKRPLRVTVSEAEETAARKPPVKKEVDNFSAEPLPLPAAILDAKAEPTLKTRAANEAAAAGHVSTAGLTSDEEGWIALAPLVHTDRDLQDAGWTWDGRSAVFSAGKPRALVSIPVRIAGSYELQTRLTITRAKEITAVYLPITSTRAVVLGIKGDRGNSESPTATIRLTGLKPEAQPRDTDSMKIGTEYALSCKVLRAGNKVDIEIRRDARVLFQWAGTVDQVAERAPMRPGTVQLQTAYYTTSRFTDLRLRMLAGEAAPLYQ